MNPNNTPARSGQHRIIISGGGTGGHVFPAIAIANAFKRRFPDAEILFVGAENRMEMEKVPAAGYPIIGLPVTGLDRRRPWKNIAVIWKFLKSMRLARHIIRDFRPTTVVGVGGYACAPILRAAAKAGIPTLLQEQNSYPGLTNRLLAKKADRICVAYRGMERFFPKDKIVLTGNPVRRDLLNIDATTRAEAFRYFNLDPARRTILLTGGSLGAQTLNQSVLAHLPTIAASNAQIIWQTGSHYYRQCLEACPALPENVHITEFISRMDLACAAADLVVSRAGAGAIAEFCLLRKPLILVPSPNVAADHQTKNAMALSRIKAARPVSDATAVQELIPLALRIVNTPARLRNMRNRIARLALPDADNRIVAEILKLTAPSAIYFVGAGGIGMSALIRYSLAKGLKVGGYDRIRSDLTDSLNNEGAQIHYTDNIALIPSAFKDAARTLVVYTPAVPPTLSELKFFRNRHFRIIKRAQLLGEITYQSRALCFAGTHGKTTTSSMAAHLLKQSHVDCNAFLGGILKNYRTNLLLSDASDLTVVEADEYDRSFHQLTPYMAVITAADPDHLDIYGTKEAYEESFNHFTSLIRPGGVLIMKKGLPLQPRLQPGVRLYTYSMEPGSDFYAENIRIGNGKIYFDYVSPTEKIHDIRLGVPLKINIENAVAAIAIARFNDVYQNEIKNAMASFQGAKRRFEFYLNNKHVALIDDYAHHPEELKASILSIRELYPDRKLTVVFQPHLYSRTNDFYPQFAESLSLADEVILLDIYPAREVPIPGVTSQLILDRITIDAKQLTTKKGLLDIIKNDHRELIMMAGAGDIERLLVPVRKILKQKIKAEQSVSISTDTTHD
jgi:UDP-N-acetylmuramate--alanine ligase